MNRQLRRLAAGRESSPFSSPTFSLSSEVRPDRVWPSTPRACRLSGVSRQAGIDCAKWNTSSGSYFRFTCCRRGRLVP